MCVVISSRASYARVRSVLRAIQQEESLELVLLVGASTLLHRFGQAIDVIRADGFRVDGTIRMIVEGETPATMAKSTGLGLLELPTLFEIFTPDIVVTIADRFETLATAIAASYMNIPLAHIQGGEVSGSIDESVRHAVTKLAHLHLSATRLSAERLIRMGEAPESVFVVGCPSVDTLVDHDLSLDPGLLRPFGGVGPDVDLERPFLLVLQHPVTTEYGQGLPQIEETLAAIDTFGMQTIMLWPNVDAGAEDIAKGIRIRRERGLLRNVHLYRNLPVEVFNKLLRHCACVIGNSSAGIREGSFLGTPVVNIGSRQAGRERGPNVVDVGHDRREIVAAIARQVEHGRFPPVTIYGDGKAGQRIAEILATWELRTQKRLTY